MYDVSRLQAHASQVLLVGFSAQGPGMQQWQAAAVAPLRALGASIDALYLADPSNSYYLQDPGCGWGGIAHFSALVRRHSKCSHPHVRTMALLATPFSALVRQHAQYYDRVLMVGSSMGGAAALMHAHHAHEVLAFGPRVDLERTHGSYVPDAAKRACASGVHASLRAMRGHATVHVGSGNAVDVMQARLYRIPLYHPSQPSALLTPPCMLDLMQAGCYRMHHATYD